MALGIQNVHTIIPPNLVSSSPLQHPQSLPAYSSSETPWSPTVNVPRETLQRLSSKAASVLPTVRSFPNLPPSTQVFNPVMAVVKANVAPSTPVKKTKTSRKRSPPTLQPADKKKRKSRIQFAFSKEFLSQYFHVSQKTAAHLLGVATITVKRCCKREGFKWPYRANKYRLAKEAKKKEVKREWTDKAIAFHQLPLDCLKVADDDMPQDVGSECATDTESVDEEEQEKKDACAGLFMLMKAVRPCVGVQRKIQL